MAKVFLLLGGNIGDKFGYIKKAKDLIIKNIGAIKKESSLYESEPWGFKDESFFINQVVEIQTDFKPAELLDKTQKIEKALGRERNSKGYASRTIDIDILFYDDMIFQSETLTIPHKLLHERRFTIAPMNEISPETIHPIFKVTISELFVKCEDKLKVEKID
jgi:2-amino-4-hydroxy-6-hydroxymethyldihydropteridine diphosphokinase